MLAARIRPQRRTPHTYALARTGAGEIDEFAELRREVERLTRKLGHERERVALQSLIRSLASRHRYA